MKYEYTVIYDTRNTIEPPRRVPLVDLELFGPKNSIKISGALIDSGADYCLFNSQYAKVLGINLDKCSTKPFIGIGGLNEITVHMINLDLRIEHLEKINIPIGFIDSPSVNVLLGQIGFFDNNKIKFERDHFAFEITPAKKQ